MSRALAVRMWIAVVGAVALVVPLSGAPLTKFHAWSVNWTDSSIPLQLGGLDPRGERQHASFTANAAVLAFASQYTGHLYIVGDEPDGSPTCYTPAQYAQVFRDFVVAVRAVDPTSRFSPAGFQHPNGQCGGLHFVDYADAFYTAYSASWGPPPVAEWRFHYFPDQNNLALFKSSISGAAAWSVAHGAPMVIGSYGFPDAGFHGSLDVRPYMREIMDWLETQPNVVGAAWWSYDYPCVGDPAEINHPHALAAGCATNPRTLSVDGLVYQEYTTRYRSAVRSGFTALGDFNGDGFADYADHAVASGNFYVHLNNQNGTFQPQGVHWAEGTTACCSDWEALVADFTGDGLADFADLHVPSGQLWVHRNTGSGGLTAFDTNVWAFNTGPSGADWEQLAGDFDGDGRADIIEHHLSTGLIFWKRNLGNGSFAYPTADGQRHSVGRTTVGADWRTIVANFTGNSPTDRRADIAEYHVPTGYFRVHKNVPWGGAEGGYALTSVLWGQATATAGSGWQLLIGDFTGDGFADFADLALGSGNFYIHQNYQNGTFALPGIDWGGGTAACCSAWTILGSR